ncbi:AtpZ/AtpI family protein [Helicobacter typhlonius]|uniref:AtpZ/AtpI family protein n=1 Tax=Helicobacter typhlonius TaxID=76936 RepID=A0A0S4Q011_9HELI|nr:AtpZ/AtpI family protein [Helicobacter typhlonius]TLD78807.1 hypothetical protein LS75_003365 [Helicobacter typhlonius]CUU40802.1 FIG00713296: Hypothetical protein [Helicobacter typhlonius]HCD73334.1 hypothetical protein [Helicobacter sp.]
MSEKSTSPKQDSNLSIESQAQDSTNAQERGHSTNEDKALESKHNDVLDSKPTLGIVASGANELSVGISIVVAVLLGIGIGILLERVSGQKWLFWLGVVWGIAAAILNLYRAYKRAQKEAEELAAHPRYSYKGAQKDDEEDSQNGVYY